MGGITRSDRNVDEYLASLSDDVRNDMQTLDKLICGIVGDEERSVHEGTFWGGSQQVIIGYKMMTMVGKTRTVKWPAIAMAKQKDYISLYLSAADGKQYVAEKYGKDLGKVKVGKSSISFTKLEDIDMEKLKLILERTLELTSKMTGKKGDKTS